MPFAIRNSEWYNLVIMEKTILIAGKEFPDGSELSAGALLHRQCVLITCGGVESKKSSDGAVTVVWNRASALSARSLLISALNHSDRLDEVVLVFDELYFAPKFGNPGAAESNRSYDELILSYQFLTTEVLLRFNQRKIAGLEKNPPKIVFLYKSNPTEAQGVLNPNVRTSGRILSKSLVAAAGAAFKAFAENTAAAVAETNDVTPVLVECAPSNELYSDDGALATWLCGYLDGIDGLKHPLSVRQKVSWIKAGAKNHGKFAMFGL